MRILLLKIAVCELDHVCFLQDGFTCYTAYEIIALLLKGIGEYFTLRSEPSKNASFCNTLQQFVGAMLIKCSAILKNKYNNSLTHYLTNLNKS